MPEKIPCPVDGCDEEFDDEAAAIVHMKEKHRDDFAPAPTQIIPPGEPPEDDVQKNPEKVVPIGRDNDVDAALAMVPPGLMKAIETRMDARIGAALEAFMPQVQAAVKGSIEQVIDQARQAGLSIPGVTDVPLKEGGVVPGSPVTPTGAAFLQFLMKGGGGSDMENLAKTLTQARAISDVLNPPTVWDRVMQNAVLRSLGKAGLVTDSELKELTEKPP